MENPYQNYPTLPSRENPCASRYVSTCGDGCPIKGAPRGGTGFTATWKPGIFQDVPAPGPCEACFATRWRWRGFRFVGENPARDWDSDRTTKGPFSGWNMSGDWEQWAIFLKTFRSTSWSTFLKRLAQSQHFFSLGKWLASFTEHLDWEIDIPFVDFFAAKLVCQSGVWRVFMAAISSLRWCGVERMEFGQSAQVPALVTLVTQAVKQGDIWGDWKQGTTAARRKVKKILLKHPRKGDNQKPFSTRESDQDNSNSEKTTITEKTTVSYRTDSYFDGLWMDGFWGIF